MNGYGIILFSPHTLPIFLKKNILRHLRGIMTKRQEKVSIGLLAFSLLPIWTSGLREKMTLWEWIINHTTFGAPSEYIPEEYYLPDNPVPLET